MYVVALQSVEVFPALLLMLLLPGDLLHEYQASPHLQGLNMPEVQHHMQHMRHQTFKRLTEQGPPSSRAAGQGAAAAAGQGAGASSSGAGLSNPLAGIPGIMSLPGMPHDVVSPVGSGMSTGTGVYDGVELNSMKQI